MRRLILFPSLVYVFRLLGYLHKELQCPRLKFETQQETESQNVNIIVNLLLNAKCFYLYGTCVHKM